MIYHADFTALVSVSPTEWGNQGSPLPEMATTPKPLLLKYIGLQWNADFQVALKCAFGMETTVSSGICIGLTKVPYNAPHSTN